MQSIYRSATARIAIFRVTISYHTKIQFLSTTALHSIWYSVNLFKYVKEQTPEGHSPYEGIPLNFTLPQNKEHTLTI